MKIVAFSDTHSKHKNITIPECDVAICAGDISSIGQKHEIASFLGWFSKQNCKHKVFIAGNHDRCFDPNFQKPLEADKWLSEMLDFYKVNHEGSNITYLENSSVVIDGIKIWGSPITPWFHGDRWAFNKHRGPEIAEVWENIPLDADIVVTHGPVAYKLDYTQIDKVYVGCEDLRKRLEIVKPKFHICGHIHEGYGVEEGINTTFVNASTCNLHYSPTNPLFLFTI